MRSESRGLVLLQMKLQHWNDQWHLLSSPLRHQSAGEYPASLQACHLSRLPFELAIGKMRLMAAQRLFEKSAPCKQAPRSLLNHASDHMVASRCGRRRPPVSPLTRLLQTSQAVSSIRTPADCKVLQRSTVSCCLHPVWAGSPVADTDVKLQAKLAPSKGEGPKSQTYGSAPRESMAQSWR